MSLKTALFLPLLGLIASCGHSQTTVSIRNMNCAGAGNTVLETLEELEAVQSSSFDPFRAEVHITHDADKLPAEQLLAYAVDQTGYDLVLGPNQGSYVSAVSFDDSMDVQWLTRTGEEVTLEDHIVPGKITIFDFYADWCGPCRLVDEIIYDALKERSDIAYRKINIVEWGTPVTRQHMQEADLPFTIIYNPAGERISRISGLNIELLEQALSSGAP